MPVVVGQVGCGYWGPNLLRNLVRAQDCSVKWVAEESPSRREYVSHTYPTIAATANWHDLLNDPDLDAVVVATPAATHAEVGGAAIAAGKHVFIEKPLATSVEDADALCAAAAAAGLTLMVGHTFIYSPAVAALRELVSSGAVGDIHHFYTQRLNLGQVRSDVNALWNLAPHDFSILLHLMEDKLPASVSARGVSQAQPQIEDVVFATLEWDNGVVGHVHVSWLDPIKIRRVTAVGSSKMVVYDDTDEYKLRVYDKGIDRVPRAGESMEFDTPASFQVLQRTGAVYMPQISNDEPLRVEMQHFIDCIQSGEIPATGAENGWAVVAMLEAAQSSLRQRGAPVSIPPRSKS